MASLLISKGWNVVFCAADGVTAYSADCKDFHEIFNNIQALAPNGMTFSMGVGSNLRQSYVALLAAKSSGKGKTAFFSSLPDAD